MPWCSWWRGGKNRAPVRGAARRHLLRRELPAFRGLQFGAEAKLVHTDPQALDLLDRFDRSIGWATLSNLALARSALKAVERAEMRAAPVNVRELIDALLAACAGEVNARGVAVNVALPFVSVNADPDGLAMALRNLLENALKFTRETPHPEIEFGGRAWAESVPGMGATFYLELPK